jgi:hypothetical protein
MVASEQIGLAGGSVGHAGLLGIAGAEPADGTRWVFRDFAT